MDRLGSIRGPERRKKPELVTPFHTATLQAFATEMPEKAAELDAVLSEIDRQAIENFSVFESKAETGVSFSYTTLRIAPDLIRRISVAGPETSQQDESAVEMSEEIEPFSDAKRIDYVLFTAFVLPPGGNAFTAQDVGIDRFIRLLPQVANSMRRGETPPEITIHLLGSPTGFGGTVTSEWAERFKLKGFDAESELCAEFIRSHIPDVSSEQKPSRLVLQGVSKGAIVAQKTSSYLPESMQAITQRLLDNPAGDHDQKNPMKWLSGAQVALGVSGEIGVRLAFDDVMKTLAAGDQKFLEALSARKGIPLDGSVQKTLKRGVVKSQVFKLLEGSSLDTENTRSFIRRAIYDPTTMNLQDLYRVWEKSKGEPGLNSQLVEKGRSVEAPFEANHLFIYDRYKRWAQILDFVKNTEV